MRSVSTRCHRLSVWPRPVNGKNWCTRIDALLTDPPAADEERDHERRVKPVCGSLELCNCLAGSAILPPPPSAYTVHGIFFSDHRRCCCERRKRRMRFYKPVRALYIRVCIEGREKKKEKNECKLFEHEMQRTNVFFFTFRLYTIGTNY